MTASAMPMAIHVATAVVKKEKGSAVAMAPGCAARLFGRADFGGVDLVLRDSARSLRGTALGNNNTSSIRVSCRR